MQGTHSSIICCQIREDPQFHERKEAKFSDGIYERTRGVVVP